MGKKNSLSVVSQFVWCWQLDYRKFLFHLVGIVYALTLNDGNLVFSQIPDIYNNSFEGPVTGLAKTHTMLQNINIRRFL